MKKTAFTNLLVLVPHPDDESAMCGGLIARAARLGMKVDIAIITTGTHGRTLGLVKRRELTAARKAEAESATAALGAKKIHFLGYKDYNPRRQKIFEWKDLHRKILAAATVNAKTLIVSFPPNGLNGHPDHVRCANLARELAEEKGAGLLCFTPLKQPATFKELPCYMPGTQRKKLHIRPTHELKMSVAEMEAKLMALSHYRTQALSILDFIRHANGKLSSEHYAFVRTGGKSLAGLLSKA
jgi:LmbE family N-acetylglucosaminyl deacetylase